MPPNEKCRIILFHFASIHYALLANINLFLNVRESVSLEWDFKSEQYSRGCRSFEGLTLSWFSGNVDILFMARARSGQFTRTYTHILVYHPCSNLQRLNDLLDYDATYSMFQSVFDLSYSFMTHNYPLTCWCIFYENGKKKFTIMLSWWMIITT